MRRLALALAMSLAAPAVADDGIEPYAVAARPHVVAVRYPYPGTQMWVYWSNHVVCVFNEDGLGGWDFQYSDAW